MTGSWVVVGGAGFLGTAVSHELLARGHEVQVLDAAPETTDDPVVGPTTGRRVRTVADVLVEDVVLGPGHVVLAHGQGLRRPVRPWTLVLSHGLSTARLAARLSGRRVTVLSTTQVPGAPSDPAPGATRSGFVVDEEVLSRWVDRALRVAEAPCHPHTTETLCAELSDLDPTGRWVHAISKLAQERVLERVVPPERLTVLRIPTAIGAGHHGLLGRMVEAALAARRVEVGDGPCHLVSARQVALVVADDPGAGTFEVSGGSLRLREVARIVAEELRPSRAHETAATTPEPVEEAVRAVVRELVDHPVALFPRPLPVVVPPRPEHPQAVADRTADALWSGTLRGGRWSRALEEALGDRLALGGAHTLRLTNSGTNALRLAVTAVAPRPAPGDVALCPAFTFHATSEVLCQLGWTVRLVDVDERTWTLDPDLVERALEDPAVKLVVVVDALGCPADYARLTAVCRRAGRPLVADSAAALGATSAGRPVGTQADAHAYSMSFAKVVSGAGCGGAVVLPSSAVFSEPENWGRSTPMTEPSAIAALDLVDALDDLVGRREEVARTYHDGTCDLPGFSSQEALPGDRHALVHWVTRVPEDLGRDRLATALSAEGVQTKPYYEPLAHRLAAHLPVTRRLHEQALALPMSSELSTDDAERVVTALWRARRRTAARDQGVAPGPGAR